MWVSLILLRDAKMTTKKKLPLASEWRCFLPLFFGFLTVFFGVAIMEWWEVDEVSFGAGMTAVELQDQFSLSPIRKSHLAARFYVYCAFLVFFFTSVMVFMLSLRQMWQSLAGREVVVFGRSIGIFLPVVSFSFLLGSGGFLAIEFVCDGLLEALLPEVFEATLQQCSARGCGSENMSYIDPDTGGKVPLLSLYELLAWQVKISTFLSAVVSVFFAVSVCCLSIEARRELRNCSLEEAGVRFKILHARWRSQLYFASIFLISGVLALYFWRRWPAAFVKPVDDSRGSEISGIIFSVADGTVVFHSIVFAATLFSVFIPAMFLISDAYTKCSRGEGVLGVQEAFEVIKGVLNLREFLQNLLAITAPVIGASVGAMIADLVQ